MRFCIEIYDSALLKFLQFWWQKSITISENKKSQQKCNNLGKYKNPKESVTICEKQFWKQVYQFGKIPNKNVKKCRNLRKVQKKCNNLRK